ncbi:Protein RER1B [Striga hermonthica]|uniref:Protein RER1B n=1 Tax=Striga hermonthica TaxID=68872 RepID=A0A9N7RES8_STRHE|nr:Protein RER1B [Striga hermonthica]
MDGVGGDGPPTAAAALSKRKHEMSKLFQYYLDKSTPHSLYRWIATFSLVCVYALRVYYLQGFYIVTYGLGIYILNLLIGFLSPLVDPELEPSDGPMLPTKGSDEFKPFIRRLPEFKFWYAITKAFCVAFLMTFFSISVVWVVFEPVAMVGWRSAAPPVAGRVVLCWSRLKFLVVVSVRPLPAVSGAVFWD